MKTEYETAVKLVLTALVLGLLFSIGLGVRAEQKGTVTFQIVDAELHTGTAQGGASLKGARIFVWRLEEERTGCSGDSSDGGTDGGFSDLTGAKKTFAAETVTDQSGMAVIKDLPAGEYLAKQTSPSRGYLPDTNWNAVFSVSDDGQVSPVSGFRLPDEQHGFPYVLIREQVKRADLRFRKEDAKGSNPNKSAYEIALLGMDGEVIESHVYVTDENGVIDTSLREITFGGNRQMTGRDGALIFGLYRITEVPDGTEKNVKENGKIFYTDASGNVADPAEYFENGIVYTVTDI